MSSLLFFVLLLPAVLAEEVATSSSLLRPRNYNYHAYDYEQYSKPLEQSEPTKQGPVLFPNDSPPPPRPPLIVTSRPLAESIARSELNPDTENNTIPSQSQINRVAYKPDYLARLNQLLATTPDYLSPKADFLSSKPDFLSPKRDFLRPKPAVLNKVKPLFLAKVKNYKPFLFPATTAAPIGLPYSEATQQSRFDDVEDYRYNDYETQPALPPIYKALSDHANEKASKINHGLPDQYDYQDKDPKYRRYQNGNQRQDDEDYNANSNYAFSYTVRDHKTGDDFSHSQQSTGSATNGEYRVRLPDGRMQIVSYTADENGYKADVRYDDEDKTDNTIDNNNGYNRNGNDNYHRANDYKHDANNYNHVTNDYNHNINDYNRNNDGYYQNQNYIDGTRNYIGANNEGYTENHDNQEFVQNRNFKPAKTSFKPATTAAPVKEDYNQYSDISKEYTNDYSAEYDGKHDNYEPHKDKFGFAKNNAQTATTVKPSYDELKDLFVTKKLYSVPTGSYYNPVEINVPSTTPGPNFEGTTEHVVVIGTTKPNLYTNIRNGLLSATPSPLTYTTSNFPTPRSYLVSTIANLKNGEKPVLSSSFIDRINKYLTFT